MTDPIVRAAIAKAYPTATIVEEPAAVADAFIFADACTPSAEALARKYGGPIPGAATPSDRSNEKLASVHVQIPLSAGKSRQQTLIVDETTGTIVASSG